MNEDILREEQLNLDETMDFLSAELTRETGILSGKREDLKEMNRYMWTEYSFVRPGDEEREKEITQLLARFNQAAHAAGTSANIVRKYQRLLASPYFGRFDIEERGVPGADRVYLGFHNLFDLNTGRVYVYDWRSPIASVFYRYELGPCHYDSPDGRVEGEVLLKRQIKVENASVKFYADSGLVIRDDILLEALSRSATPKMRAIVETIQKEQDIIIRDLTSEILIVSGTAGSGKTSIALHRVAYLLYESKTTKATSRNVLILSPNGVFSDYVDRVLPDLGEEQVRQATIDDLHQNIIRKANVQTKHAYLEGLMRMGDAEKLRAGQRAFAFKNSRMFARIIDRYALLYERRLHRFSDVMLRGRLLYTAQELKALFLDNKAKLPAAARLRRVFDRVAGEAEAVFDEIRAKLKPIVYDSPTKRFEEEEYLDRTVNAMRNRFRQNLRGMLSFEPVRLYRDLLTDRKLMSRLTVGTDMPQGFRGMLARGAKAVGGGFIPFEDAGALMYLTERLCGVKAYADLRHVVLDEAQDYSPINYLTFSRLFRGARFTILGDSFQTVGKYASPSFFERVRKYMGGGKAELVSLTKSYRSSMEIHRFCLRVLGPASAALSSESYSRSGEEPEVAVGSEDAMLRRLSETVVSYKRGSAAILTKTEAEARTLFDYLETDAKTLTVKNEKLTDGVNIMPVYMSKGLEFDYVIVWGADRENYKTPFDRRLLYVACTRALHKLSVFACGSLTEFLSE